MYQNKVTNAVKVIDNYKCHTYKCPPPEWLARNVISRAKKMTPTPEEQKKVNEQSAYDKLKYLILCNFIADDFYITLTYENEPEPEDAKTILKKFINRLKYFFNNLGQILKYIHVTEYEKNKKKERIHHHIIINKIPEIGIRQIKKIWGQGRIDYRPYRGEPDDAEGIAGYFIKEEHSAFYKDEKIFKTRYTPSRNLKQPDIKRHRVAASTFREPIKAPEGYYLDKSTIRHGLTNWGYPYLFYRFIKIEEEEHEKLERHAPKERPKRRAETKKNQRNAANAKQPAKNQAIRKKIRNEVKQWTTSD